MRAVTDSLVVFKGTKEKFICSPREYLTGGAIAVLSIVSLNSHFSSWQWSKQARLAIWQ